MIIFKRSTAEISFLKHKKAREDFAQAESELTEAFLLIDAKELSEELKLILKDYFLGTVSENEKPLQIKFLNGQKFNITIEQCG